MMDTSLSLDQAPPFRVVYPFFVVASVWGMITGIMVTFFDFETFLSGRLPVFGLLHSVVLGMFISVMVGALFQMSPVLAGIKITHHISKVLLLLLNGGTVMLVYGFETGCVEAFMGASGVLLGGIVVLIFGFKEYGVRSLSMATSLSMRYALIAFVVAGSLGIAISYSLGSDGILLDFAPLHGMWMIFGWVIVLIMGVSYQVISMFYVTPVYPKRCTYMMPLFIITLLVIFSIVYLFNMGDFRWFIIILDMCVIGWGSVTIKNIVNRKRKMVEPPLWFWIIGVILLMMSAMLHGIMTFVQSESNIITMLLFVCGVWSIMQGMMLKIIPFMTWFHLTNQGISEAPMMRELVAPIMMKRLLFVWGVTLLLVVTIPFHGQICFSGIFVTLCSFYLGIIITRPIMTYERMKKAKV